MKLTLTHRQRGFAVLEIIIIAAVVVAIGGVVAWRLMSNQPTEQKNILTGPLTSEDRATLQRTQAHTQTTPTDRIATGEQSSDSTDRESSASGTSGSGSSTGRSNGSSTQSSGNTSSTPSASNSNDSGTSTAPTSTITRPTTTFCQQKDGASFDAWVTDNRSHTYQVWENGGWVSKTETGTAALNFDSMQVVAVVPHPHQAAWASCSQKAGYISFYYKPAGSVYTYNWIVPFEYISVTKP